RVAFTEARLQKRPDRVIAIERQVPDVGARDGIELGKRQALAVGRERIGLLRIGAGRQALFLISAVDRSPEEIEIRQAHAVDDPPFVSRQYWPAMEAAVGQTARAAALEIVHEDIAARSL